VHFNPVAAQRRDQRGIGVEQNNKPTASNSSQRVALVTGNSAYATSPSKNPVNDARDIAQALRELGFEVIYQEDQSQNDMKRAIRTFGQKARSAGIRLFYYAGPGMQVNGENYLIPVDANFNNEREVEYETVNAGLVLAQMEEVEESLNIIILDACRNNPFARSFRSASRGLAAINAPSGRLIAYATAPGSVASDYRGITDYKDADGDGYPDEADSPGKLIIGFGAGTDRFEDWHSNARPLPPTTIKDGRAVANPRRDGPEDADPASRKGTLMSGQVENGESAAIATGPDIEPMTNAVHTAADIPLTALGTGAMQFIGVQDNTAVFFKMMRAYGGSFPRVYDDDGHPATPARRPRRR